MARNLTIEDILYRLIALNEQRVAEEHRGLIRWLRPDFQQAPQPGQAGLDIAIEEAPTPVSTRRPWPATLPARVGAIRAVLAGERQPLDANALARIFTRARTHDVREIAETLVSLGQARRVEDRYVV